MSDQTFDPRLESLLRDVLKTEAASLPLLVGPEQILERGRARRGSTSALRLRLPRLSMVVAAGAAVALFAVAAVMLSSLPRSIDSPGAPLPASPSDWTRLEVESTLSTGSIGEIAAGPKGLVAIARSDSSGATRVLFSADGRDWSATDVSPRGIYVSVVATDRGFLMTSSEEGAFFSENGLNWQRVATNWSGDPDAGGSIVVSAAAGGPGYLAAGSNNKIWYSTDGSGWAVADVPPPPADLILPDFPDLVVDILEVGAVGENLVATGYYVAENSDATGASRDFVLASNDGRTWSTVLPDMGDREGPLHLVAGPNGFLIIGGPLDGSRQSTVWQSVDGRTWQSSVTDDFESGTSDRGCTSRVRLEDIAATSGGYVAVGIEHECMDGDFPASPPRAVIWTSEDGRSWTRLPESDLFNLPVWLDSPGTATSSITPWGSRFVIGGMHGGDPVIWISGSDRP